MALDNLTILFISKYLKSSTPITLHTARHNFFQSETCNYIKTPIQQGSM